MFLFAACATNYDREEDEKLNNPEYNENTKDEHGELKDCNAAREYITITKYLRSKQEDLALDEQKIRVIADKVSQGCDGAAARFTQAFELLQKVEVGGNTALGVSMDLSNRSNEYAKAFIGIFKRSYLAEYLDLDLKTSIHIARSLSVSYEGYPELALADFALLTEFCMENEKSNLPIQVCARIAGRVSKSAEKFEFGLAKPLIETYKYLRDHPAAPLPNIKALRWAERIVRSSPAAYKNFKMAYEFALSQEGFDAAQPEALGFALRIADRTRNPNFDPEALPEQRLPASDKVDKDLDSEEE